jgi:outer membrane protein, heavy metal efflux system
MQRTRFWPVAALTLAGVWLSGCTTRPAEQGLRETSELVSARDASVRTAASPSPSDTDNAVRALLAQPLSADAAVQIAVLRNPRLQIEYARLGVAEADVLEASRLSNPTLSLSVLDPRVAGTPSRVDAGISQAFTELLLLKPRKRLAAGEYERTQQVVAASILGLAADVRAAWYENVGAQHIATMRDSVARAAQLSAGLADRLHEAGNISALQLNLEHAAATQARVAATRAHAEATRTRALLTQGMGVRASDGPWTTLDRLPAPVPREDSVDELLPVAARERLDVAAARREVGLQEDALGITEHYRWLGRIDIGLAGERDTDRTRLVGPTLAVQLPVFNQGQGTIARAHARLEDSRARLQALELSVDTSVRLGADRIQAARAVLEEYRSALIPEREAVVARTQENVNYMFAGAFDLLLAKQQEYDAYQGYLEAVRDYWLARVDLTRAVGTRLPSDSTIGEPTLGPDPASIPPPRSESPQAHHESGGGAP